MENNTNIEVGRCLCSFSYGIDRIFVFEHPDENVGYISGWIFSINCIPYFYSVAQGSEGLNTYLANTYATYLHSIGEKDCIKNIMDQDDLWGLDDDTMIAFDETFSDAMYDAGYRQDKTGRWEYKHRKKKRA